MIQQKVINDLLNEKLTGSDIFVCDIQISRSNVITVFIDGDHGVNIDHCSELSRFLEEKLDRDSEDYELRVSSFGADRPLLMKRQFPKHKGRTLHIVREDGTEITGVFESMDELSVYLKPLPAKSKKQEIPGLITVPFDSIREANVVISFH